MKLGLEFGVLALTVLAGCSAIPGSDPKEADEHAAHHPPGAAATPAPSGYEQQMTTMQEMHRRMAEAKTPEERAALMKDHMKTMRDGMAMMGRMRGETMGNGGMGDSQARTPMDPATMKRRMDMMEMMMQMMMDREGTRAPATR